MSSPRGLANHHLYLGRLLLAAWQREREAGQVPAATLDQAFAPGCHAHLLQAYGWFLLAIVGPEELPASPPAGVSELPSQPAGKAVPGEVREFEQLEQGGWLADLLAWQPALPGAARRGPGNLARTVTTSAGPEDFTTWAGELEALFDRMGDSLDEY